MRNSTSSVLFSLSEGLVVISPFIRVRISGTEILTSVCTLCQQSVGSSANTDALTIAEIAHNCRNQHMKNDKAPKVTRAISESP